MHVLRPSDMRGFREPLAALQNSIHVATCCGCDRRLDFVCPPGKAAAWTQATEAPPLLLIEIKGEVARAAEGGKVILQPECVHSLFVPMANGTQPIKVQYRLVAATMYKPSHYATCMIDEETGQWLQFDGMLQGEGAEGPRGRGIVIPPPNCASSLGGLFWSVVLYAHV